MIPAWKPPTPFLPFFPEAHLATIAGNFWQRPSLHGVPVEELRFVPEPGVEILILKTVARQSQCTLVLLHGLEGSAESGYMRSLTHAAFNAGFSTLRCNMRACGGTEDDSCTMYHAGLTADTKELLKTLDGPVFLVGFSLGANVVLKLAGELGEGGTDWLAGVCSVSPPADLTASIGAIEKPTNLVYHRRFLTSLRERVVRRNRLDPVAFSLDGLQGMRSIRDFDDRYVAPFFGFGTASNYYATQSAIRFVQNIAVPTLVIYAEDDTLIPSSIFAREEWNNPWIQRVGTRHGGHLGYIARSTPRFWLDGVVLDWVRHVLKNRGG